MATLTALHKSAIISIEEESTKLPIHDIAAYLQEHVGQKMTAYLSGVKTAKEVGAWARPGGPAPRDESVMRLRLAYCVMRLISSVYGDGTAKSWLIGSNTRLDNEAPALLMRYATSLDDLRYVVPAALAFAGIQD